ncbi:amino acid permease [Dermatophilus congolensis]|uniref:amino acid permease n=1 Tax=Dermatophilus congolensis TaxID=1863 RepID=UPI001AAEAA58|nr:amino acid permease [Dermatophilus congolensis]MBO3143747.1 amino acid permease [Dermatophilus congolensis]MBO3152738.1 amino acid permease [Dermatophilus congolensis]MBO3160251.1 amino acid permease [Dermatophilus congolensis]MBO3164023.1 amino acid permease [Dermatophilus congolensis]MBO3177568.1 amino acid permease [Dermatophilus congolensis]
MSSSESTETSKQAELQRGLKPRHINMIAIGGAIGTGLFVASGGTISNAGPGGALVAYAAIGFMVFLLMQSLGEMATYLPIAGSFEAYGTRFVSPSFGFAMGWNYWANWAITLAVELVAAALVMQFWFPDTPGWVWSALFLAIIVSLNAINVRTFGEGEFIFASIKVVTVIVFLVVGVAMILGILGGHAPGLENWTRGEAPFVSGFAGMLSVFMIAGFSFQGTEMVGVTAGEAQEPEKSIPRAIRSVFFRIMLFYIGAIAVIGFLLPYTDSRLLSAEKGGDITIAPFTLIFENAGILGAATIMNAVILTAILSAGNSGMYVSTRMLYGLAVSGKAPKIFTKVTAGGIPLPALLATTAVGALCFLTNFFGEGTAYTWLVNASGLAGFITWMGIAWSHWKFRRAYMAQGGDPKDLPYKAALFPIGPLVALVMCAVVVVGQGYNFFSDPLGNLPAIVATYIGLPLFFSVWWGHKLVTKSKKVDPLEADLSRP